MSISRVMALSLFSDSPVAGILRAASRPGPLRKSHPGWTVSHLAPPPCTRERVVVRSVVAAANRERGPRAEVNAIADAERHPRVGCYGCRIVVDGGAVAGAWVQQRIGAVILTQEDRVKMRHRRVFGCP